MSDEYPDTDFAFRHHLYDTLVLLGVPMEICSVVELSKDIPPSASDIDRLRNYNITLIEQLKTSLSNIHHVKVRVKQ